MLTLSRFTIAVGLALAGASLALPGCASEDAASAPSLDDAGTDAPRVEEVDAGTDAADDAAAPVATVAVAEVCVALATSTCSFLETCSPEMVEALWPVRGDCDARFRDNCLAAYPPAAEVRKDDAELTSACMGAAACYEGSPLLCPLPRLAVTSPLGATCRGDFECESNSCSGNSRECGSCTKRNAVGEPCSESAECPRGGYCWEKCFAPAFLGEACDEHSVCTTGLACSGGKCVRAGGVGATCTSSSDCDLLAAIACNRATGKCEKLSFADEGEACPPRLHEGPPVACAKGSQCVNPDPEEPGTCVAQAKVGEACGDDKPCESYINCRGGKCVLPTYVACP
jgi:hypothetical protein